MEKVYRHLPWLDMEQATDYMGAMLKATPQAPFTERLLIQLCEAGECPVYLDCQGRRGVAYFETTFSQEGEAGVYGFGHARLLSVRAFSRAKRIPVFGECDSVFLGFDEREWWIDRDDPRGGPEPTPLFKPADLEALAAKMNGEPAPPRTAEAEVKQQAAEPSPKSRNAYLRTIAALGYALIGGGSGQPHPDADAILVALGAKGIAAPVGPKTLADYLKQAADT